MPHSVSRSWGRRSPGARPNGQVLYLIFGRAVHRADALVRMGALLQLGLHQYHGNRRRANPATLCLLSIGFLSWQSVFLLMSNGHCLD